MSNPLPLNSPMWADLRDAYGSAQNIPGLLTQLREIPELTNDPNEEPMFSLWSGLCHQDTVYGASFAAFPHLVDIAGEKNICDRGQILLLATAILAATDSPHQYIVKETEKPYYEAIPRALKLLSEAFVDAEEITGEAMPYWLGSFAALKGKPATARQLFGLESLVDSYLSKELDYPIEDQFLVELRGE